MRGIHVPAANTGKQAHALPGFISAPRLHRQMALVLQARDHFLARDRLHLAIEGLAGAGEGLVAEQRH